MTQSKERVMGEEGLYRSSFEHDNCGIGAVVNIKGEKSHATVENALKIVENLEHRAGKDAEGKTGDGVGILLQISHKFFSKACLTSSWKKRDWNSLDGEPCRPFRKFSAIRQESVCLTSCRHSSKNRRMWKRESLSTAVCTSYAVFSNRATTTPTCHLFPAVPSYTKVCSS